MTGLFSEMAEYYDLMNSFKNYRRETTRLIGLVRRYGRSGGREWLDVGCGTGRHLRYLSRRFRCTGVDASSQMLRVARREVPGVRFERGDMRTFRLGKQFDVVSCLFSAIGHVRTESGLRRAIASLAAHVKPGGVLIIEPWFTPKTWHVGMVHLLTAGTLDLKLARASYSTARGSQSILRMHFLIARKGRGVHYKAVTGISGLFEHATTLKWLRKAGLRSRFYRQGLMLDRGLFVGVRPLPPVRRRAQRGR